GEARLNVEQIVDEIPFDRIDAEPRPDGLGVAHGGSRIGYQYGHVTPSSCSGRTVLRAGGAWVRAGPSRAPRERPVVGQVVRPGHIKNPAKTIYGTAIAAVQHFCRTADGRGSGPLLCFARLYQLSQADEL